MQHLDSKARNLLWAKSPSARSARRSEGDFGAAVEIACRQGTRQFRVPQEAAKPKMLHLRVLSLRPNKNESYDTFSIATFVLFLCPKSFVAQGFCRSSTKD